VRKVSARKPPDRHSDEGRIAKSEPRGAYGYSVTELRRVQFGGLSWARSNRQVARDHRQRSLPPPYFPTYKSKRVDSKVIQQCATSVAASTGAGGNGRIGLERAQDRRHRTRRSGRP
jgi:hypothetical protein